MSTHTEPSDGTVFTFLPGSVDVVGACALLRAAPLGFEPTIVRVSLLGEESVELPYDDDVWQKVTDTAEVTDLELESGILQPSASWSWTRTSTQFWLADVPPHEALLEALLDTPGLLGGASGDTTDARWQGETKLNHYRMWFDGPWEHLPRTTDGRGREIVDVSGNPGRITEVPGMRLWPAQDVWFGPAASLVVDLDEIATLPVGRVTALGEGRWHVRLWEDGASVEEIRKAQQVLRDHLGYDAAEARKDDIHSALTADQPDDPMFVAQRGTFPHGGTERFLQYFSASKHPTTRSRAAWLNIQEYDQEHHRVHDEYIDLTAQPHPDLD